MACYQGIGLDEKLISHATEKSGMLLVQVERSIRVPSSVVQQVCQFEIEVEWFLVCLSFLLLVRDDVPKIKNQKSFIQIYYLYIKPEVFGGSSSTRAGTYKYIQQLILILVLIYVDYMYLLVFWLLYLTLDVGILTSAAVGISWPSEAFAFRGWWCSSFISWTCIPFLNLSQKFLYWKTMSENIKL